jgi:hypothetical protein
VPPAHVGIAAGPVVVQGGDYFGRTVNLAARIAARAGADEAQAAIWGVGGGRLFAWLFDGDTPSQFNPMIKMSAVNAVFFDVVEFRLALAAAAIVAAGWSAAPGAATAGTTDPTVAPDCLQQRPVPPAAASLDRGRG